MSPMSPMSARPLPLHLQPPPQQQRRQKAKQLHERHKGRPVGSGARYAAMAMLLLLATGQLATSSISAQTSAPNMQTSRGEADSRPMELAQREGEEVSGGGPNDTRSPPQQQQQQHQTDVAELKTSLPLYMRLIATLVCLIIFTIGVCGNLLVPLVVIKTRYLRNSTNLFLINLSVADLLVLIVCMPLVLVELHSRPETWLLGEFMCKVSNFVETLAANGSIFTILAISFERYYAICKPLKAGYKCTRLRATIIICLIWLLACALTSPILFMAKSVQTTYNDGSLVENCILETDSYWPKMYVFVSLFAFFCLPLIVLMLVYWLISRRLIRESIAMSDNSSNTQLAAPSSPRAHAHAHAGGPASASLRAALGAGRQQANHIAACGALNGQLARDRPTGAPDVANNEPDKRTGGGGGQRQRRKLKQVSRSLTEDQSHASAAHERTKLMAVHSALAPLANRFAHARPLGASHDCQHHDHDDAPPPSPPLPPQLDADDSKAAVSANSIINGHNGRLTNCNCHCNFNSNSNSNSNLSMKQTTLGAASTRREHPMSKVNLIAMAHNISNNFHIKRAKARSGSQPLVTHHLQSSPLSALNAPPTATATGAAASASAAAAAAGGAAQNHSDQLQCAVQYLSKKHQMDSRRQVVVMLAFVVACFFLLFFPYRVFTIWLILSTEDQVQSLGMEAYYNLTYFSRILIYLHSAINPIAYNLISTKFRRAFISILLCRGPESRRQFITDTYRHAHETGTKTYSSRLNSKVNRSSSQNTTNTTSDRMISLRIVDVYANEHEVNDDLVP